MPAGDDWVVLERERSTVLVEKLQRFLESVGIEACSESYSVDDAVSRDIEGGFAGIDVLVRQADHSRAREVLAASHGAWKTTGRRPDPQPQPL